MWFLVERKGEVNFLLKVFCFFFNKKRISKIDQMIRKVSGCGCVYMCKGVYTFVNISFKYGCRVFKIFIN